MDSSKKYDLPSPEETANPLSKLFFVWIVPFLKYGYTHDLQVKDLYNCAQADLSGTLGDQLQRNWNSEVESSLKNGAKPSLLRSLRTTFSKSYFLAGLVTCAQIVLLRMYLPVALANYISYYEGHRAPGTGWRLATVLILVPLFSIIVTHSCELYFQRIGMRSRIATCSLIYRKLVYPGLLLQLLKLSKASLGDVAVGQLVNLLSNDVQRFDSAALYMHYVWIMPIQTIIAFAVMYRCVGWAALAGFVGISAQAVFLQGYLSRLQGRLRMKIARKTDSRVRLMNEITAGIRVIKMYAWEVPFRKIVALARKYEIDTISRTSYIRALSIALMMVTGRAASYLTLVTYVLLGRSLTADVVFSVSQLFNTVQLYVCIYFPLGLTFLAEAKTSIKRLEEFLLLEENPAVAPGDGPAGGVSLHGVNTPVLSGLTVQIQPGTLCCIVGPVGSGKSSFLQLLLEELVPESGTVTVSGTVSYSSQEPWLFVSSIRNNILFGRPYNRDKYKGVVKACALEPDLVLFQHGDGTLVGERGAQLSGGQRARVNLARAVYRDADIYIFDDPLSAVDAQVGNHLFNECIVDYLGGKTRVLVTHQVRFLKQADLIIVLDNGRVVKSGTFKELDLDLELLDEPSEVVPRPRLESTGSQKSSISDEDEQPEAGETQELVAKGAIATSTYREYYTAGGSITTLLFLAFLFLMAQAGCNSSDLWLTYWTNMNQTHSIYIGTYSFLIFFAIVLTISRSLLFFKVCMDASKRLHDTMFGNILQATMRFFDTNPSGRILNRFSKDMGTIDELLPPTMIEAIQVFLVMSGILVMVFIVTQWMVLVALVLGSIFYFLRRVYLKTAQDVKRLEGITRAPVFSHVSASLYGIATIRSAGAQNMVIREFDSLQDQHTGSWFLFLASNESFGFYLDLISVIFLTVVTYQFLIFDDGTTKSGNVGLVISQSLVLSGMMQHGVRRSAEVASNMTSVERILQYTKLEKEGPFESLPTKRPPREWPQHGRIVFRNVYLRYVPEHCVLTNLTLEIQAGEKVGVVGRTGAGKSSLISALFRLAPLEGAIEIDDVNTGDIGLEELRSRISIIPQEPVLFSNTVRYNLDPFEKCDDDTLWQALENVELKSVVENLDQRVQEGGSNFSAGQRQLVCLARAIVKNNKILVLDEATANVDPATDALIQATIRRNFQNCTVLTIAHRLNTIMDSDKVLVMDAGQAVEFGHPHELLQNEGGYFNGMVKEMGAAVENQLRQVARSEFDKRSLKNL